MFATIEPAPPGADGLPAFSVTVTPTETGTVVIFQGELDMVTAPRADDATRDALVTETRAMSIDCYGLFFVDSTGIRSLIRLAQACRDRGIPMTLTPSMQLGRVARTLGVEDLLGITA